MTLFIRLRSFCNICKINKTVPLTKHVLQANMYTFHNSTRILRTFTKNVSQNRQSSNFNIFKRFSPQKIKIKDNVPDQYQLIYRNTMERYLLLAQIFSTVCAGIIGIVVICKHDVEEYMLDFDTWRVKPGTMKNETLYYLTAFAGLCVMFQLLLAKMPLRIYNMSKQKDYIVIFYGSMPFTTKRITCKAKELIKLEETGILPWKDSRYEIENKCKVILLENYFRTPADLSIMLGYEESREDD